MNVIARTKPEARTEVEEPKEKPSISAAEMERRREALRRADADHRLEGLSRTPESEPIFAAFVRGEIELHEILPQVKALHHRL